MEYQDTVLQSEYERGKREAEVLQKEWPDYPTRMSGPMESARKWLGYYNRWSTLESFSADQRRDNAKKAAHMRGWLSAWGEGFQTCFLERSKEKRSTMKHDIAWYQDAFGTMKVDFQTRRNRAAHEILAFLLPSGLCRVTYLRVDQSGVTVCAEPGVNLYADWYKGDRFERMYEAMGWIALPTGTSAPEMKWDEYSVWEVTSPLPSSAGQGKELLS